MKTFLATLLTCLLSLQLLLADLPVPRPDLPPKPVPPVDSSLAPIIIMAVIICITGLAILYVVRKERRSRGN